MLSHMKKFFGKEPVTKDASEAIVAAIDCLDREAFQRLQTRIARYQPFSTASKDLIRELSVSRTDTSSLSVEGLLVEAAQAIGGYAIILGGTAAPASGVYSTDESPGHQKLPVPEQTARNALKVWLQNPANRDKGLFKSICDWVRTDNPELFMESSTQFGMQ